jgi:hypothetical protein
VTWPTLLLPAPPTNIILVLIIVAVAVLACLLLAKTAQFSPPTGNHICRMLPFFVIGG